MKLIRGNELCRTCGTTWKAPVDACPTCADALRAVERVTGLADTLSSIPQRLAGKFAGTIHPYDIADAIYDSLAPEPTAEPLAEWERELLLGDQR